MAPADRPMHKGADIRFLADAMLGRLAAWLRILGFDAALAHAMTDQDRSDLIYDWNIVKDLYPPRHEIELDSTVTVRITSDVEDEAHIHGYDHELEVGPDAPASVTFTADLPGVYSIELHGTGQVLAELVVS